jgi:hypothetical protein
MEEIRGFKEREESLGSYVALECIPVCGIIDSCLETS